MGVGQSTSTKPHRAHEKPQPIPHSHARRMAPLSCCPILACRREAVGSLPLWASSGLVATAQALKHTEPQNRAWGREIGEHSTEKPRFRAQIFRLRLNSMITLLTALHSNSKGICRGGFFSASEVSPRAAQLPRDEESPPKVSHAGTTQGPAEARLQWICARSSFTQAQSRRTKGSGGGRGGSRNCEEGVSCRSQRDSPQPSA